MQKVVILSFLALLGFTNVVYAQAKQGAPGVARGYCKVPPDNTLRSGYLNVPYVEITGIVLGAGSSSSSPITYDCVEALYVGCYTNGVKNIAELTFSPLSFVNMFRSMINMNPNYHNQVAGNISCNQFPTNKTFQPRDVHEPLTDNDWQNYSRKFSPSSPVSPVTTPRGVPFLQPNYRPLVPPQNVFPSIKRVVDQKPNVFQELKSLLDNLNNAPIWFWMMVTLIVSVLVVVKVVEAVASSPGGGALALETASVTLAISIIVALAAQNNLLSDDQLQTYQKTTAPTQCIQNDQNHYICSVKVDGKSRQIELPTELNFIVDQLPALHRN